jgi:hypothetical protein
VTRVPIVVSGWGRTVALARSAVAVIFAVTFVVFAFADDVGGISEEESAVKLVTGLVFAAACAWVAWLLARPALVRRAYLELTEDSLLVVHPGLLKRPLEIPRAAIKAATIDPRQWRWRWLGNKGRFHLGGPGNDPAVAAQIPEWLFSVVGSSPYPLLSTVDDVPNVAFVFSEPVRTRPVRRGTRPFATKGPVHVPVYGRDIRGLLIKVKDPGAAEAALSSWTTLRPFTATDVMGYEPDPVYARKAKRRRRMANVWLGLLLLLLVGGPVLTELADNAERSFVSP